MPKRDGSQDEDVIQAITMVRICQEFHVLPGAGGLLDQDSYFVWLMTCVMEADREREERERRIQGNKK